MIPVHKYFLGEALPAHLSPFVDDTRRVGDYVPPDEQNLLEEEKGEEVVDAEDDDDDDDDDDDGEEEEDESEDDEGEEESEEENEEENMKVKLMLFRAHKLIVSYLINTNLFSYFTRDM